MNAMKPLKITIFVALAAVLLYLPVSMLLQTAQAAEEVNDRSEQDILPLPEENFQGGLAPGVHTPESYIPPQYDPFNNTFHPDKEFEERVREAHEPTNAPPEADFVVRTAKGIADNLSGTIDTEFRLSAYAVRDNETRTGDLRVRWDFEGDGQWDTYFSRSKTTRHRFEEPGVYAVTLEVLDGGGRLSQETKFVTVVENTPPIARFQLKPSSGTTGQIFRFDVSDSDDSQYKNRSLKYRFDWNGDGQWDTPFKSKTIWRHRFEEPGVYTIVMEAQDPEGASGFAEGRIEVIKNRPPVPSFTIEMKTVQITSSTVQNRYSFDASGSFDPEGKKLQYRWDFNYTGANDISFTTGWTTSPKHSGVYDFPGEKTIRLQVRDEDGAIRETFARIVVE